MLRAARPGFQISSANQIMPAPEPWARSDQGLNQDMTRGQHKEPLGCNPYLFLMLSVGIRIRITAESTDTTQDPSRCSPLLLLELLYIFS